jgi:glycerol-3-phosphate dehydrogenase
MGRCQGGFCTPRVLDLLSRELGIPQTELTKYGGSSHILTGVLGDMDLAAQEDTQEKAGEQNG